MPAPEGSRTDPGGHALRCVAVLGMAEAELPVAIETEREEVPGTEGDIMTRDWI